MGKSERMWAVMKSEDGKPMFQRLNGELCESCGLSSCLPSQPHPRGMVYHVGAGRFLTWNQIESLNGANRQRIIDRKALAEHEQEIKARQDKRRKKSRERAKRYYWNKRKREVLDPQKPLMVTE
jgi:hypothetical protein